MNIVDYKSFLGSALKRICATGFGLLFLFGSESPVLAQEATSDPRIEVPNDYFYFGYMPRNAIVSHTYWIKNTGGSTLEIVKVKPGCGCTAAPLTQDKVEPGDSANLTITFDSKLITGKSVKGIDIFSNDPMHDVTSVKFFAVVNVEHEKVRTDPSTLRFAKFGSEDGRLIKELKIVNGFDDDIQLTLVEFPDKLFTIDQRTATVAAGKEIILTLEQVEVPTEEEDYLTSLTLQFEGPETERITIPIVSYFKRGE